MRTAPSQKNDNQPAAQLPRKACSRTRLPRIHCLADGCDRPVTLAVTPGNIADISMAGPLLNAIAPTRKMIADKAYDADYLRRWLKIRRIRAVIPSPGQGSIRWTAPPIDAAT